MRDRETRPPAAGRARRTVAKPLCGLPVTLQPSGRPLTLLLLSCEPMSAPVRTIGFVERQIQRTTIAQNPRARSASKTNGQKQMEGRRKSERTRLLRRHPGAIAPRRGQRVPVRDFASRGRRGSAGAPRGAEDGGIGWRLLRSTQTRELLTNRHLERNNLINCPENPSESAWRGVLACQDCRDCRRAATEQGNHNSKINGGALNRVDNNSDGKHH